MEKVHWKILRLVHTSQSQNNKTPGGKKNNIGSELKKAQKKMAQQEKK